MKHKDLNLAAIAEISQNEILVESKIKTERHKLKDAIFTLDVLNTTDIDPDFIFEKPDFFPKKKESKYEYSKRVLHNSKNIRKSKQSSFTTAID